MKFFSATLCKFFSIHLKIPLFTDLRDKALPRLVFLLSLVCQRVGPVLILVLTQMIFTLITLGLWIVFVLTGPLCSDSFSSLITGNLLMNRFVFFYQIFADGPFLTLEHTDVALVSAACLREGSCGTYAVVPVLMPGSLTKCLN